MILKRQQLHTRITHWIIDRSKRVNSKRKKQSPSSKGPKYEMKNLKVLNDLDPQTIYAFDYKF
jgi:hypothetical protein